MSRKIRTFVKWCVVVVVVLLLVGQYFFAEIVLNTVFKGENYHGNVWDYSVRVDKHYPGTRAWYDSLRCAGIFKDTLIQNEKNIPLHAVYAPAEDARGTVILVHGYFDNFFCLMPHAKMYRDTLHFNVLLPDLQRHGFSGGPIIQMGWYDRLDLLRWIEVSHSVFADSLTILQGLSMGGATVMMASGEELPPYVKGVVDECGYSSLYQQIGQEVKARHLPRFPMLCVANHLCKWRYGFSFKEASSLKQLAKSKVPVLFIHSEADTRVPVKSVYECYNAKTYGYKELWVVPDALHAKMYEKYPVEFREKVSAFIERVK